MGLDLLQDKYDNYIEEEERYLDEVNELYDFWVTMCDYPYISLHIRIFESNGKFYLQDEYFTDYKEITPDFLELLSALNLK